MANVGIYPIDAASPVGKLRLSIGDTAFTELADVPDVPPVPRDVSYANFSDADLTQLLGDAGGSNLRAKSHAYAHLAAIAAHRSVSIKTNDLGYVKEKTASELRELARFFSIEADKADDAALDESLEIVRFPGYGGAYPGVPPLV